MGSLEVPMLHLVGNWKILIPAPRSEPWVVVDEGL